MYRADLLLALEKSAIIVACAALFALLLYLALVFRLIGRSERAEAIRLATGAAFVFGLLGIVTGFTMGASRVAVVASIIPAALTFIGGLALWIVTNPAKGAAPQTPGQIVVVASSVCAFTVLLFFGLVLGAVERNRAEFDARNQSYDRARLFHEAEIEFQTNAYRDTLGLAPKDFAPTSTD